MNGMTKGGQGASWFSITHMGPVTVAFHSEGVLT